MKKQLLVLFLFISALGFAQEIRVAALAGGNLMTQSYSKISEGYSISSLPALHLGVLFSIPIKENIFFQPGLNYQLKGCKSFHTQTVTDKTSSSYETIITTTVTDTEGKQKFHYLELPINISLSFDAGGAGGGILYLFSFF